MLPTTLSSGFRSIAFWAFLQASAVRMGSLDGIAAKLPSVSTKIPRGASAQGAVAQEPSRRQLALHPNPQQLTVLLIVHSN
jgi:hypothetical protein